jgi:hypothetical protein
MGREIARLGHLTERGICVLLGFQPDIRREGTMKFDTRVFVDFGQTTDGPWGLPQ